MPSTVWLGMGTNLLGCDRERVESVRSVFGMAALESAFCLQGAAPHWAQGDLVSTKPAAGDILDNRRSILVTIHWE
ncbi:hypothetical protein, partial [Mesorhizobium salmacidum]